jgi:hypothetical protein
LAVSAEQRSCARTQESVRPSTPVESLFERLQDRAAALYVTDADGKIMMIRAVRPDWGFDRKAQGGSYKNGAGPRPAPLRCCA